MGSKSHARSMSRPGNCWPFDKPLLTTVEDVEAYLDALRNTLLDQVREGKHIRV